MEQSLIHGENQQETLAYIAGLVDGEGHTGIGRYNGYKGVTKYRAHIALSNTDPKLINFFTDFLECYDIPYYIRLRAKSSVGRDQYEVSVNRLEAQKKFLELLIPQMRSLKQDEASLALKLVKTKLKRIRPRDTDNGQFKSYADHPKDERLYRKYKELKDPQRLHGMHPKRVKI